MTDSVYSSSDSEENECQLKWRNADRYPISSNDFQSYRSFADYIRSPLQYFKDYFTEQFSSLICEQSSLYAHQKDPSSSFSLNIEELHTFLGCCMYMSIFRFPNVYFYWKTNTPVAQIADVMSRNRFEEIKRHLHFADNNKAPDHPPKDYKFSPLIDQFNKVANKIEPVESLSVDEQIMPYKGKKVVD